MPLHFPNRLSQILFFVSSVILAIGILKKNIVRFAFGNFRRVNLAIPVRVAFHNYFTVKNQIGFTKNAIPALYIVARENRREVLTDPFPREIFFQSLSLPSFFRLVFVTHIISDVPAAVILFFRFEIKNERKNACIKSAAV